MLTSFPANGNDIQFKMNENIQLINPINNVIREEKEMLTKVSIIKLLLYPNINYGLS